MPLDQEEVELLDILEDKLRPLLELDDYSCHPTHRRLHADAKAALFTIFLRRHSNLREDASGSKNLADFFEASEALSTDYLIQQLDLEDLDIMDIFTDLMSSIFKQTVDYQHEKLSDISRYREVKQLFLDLRCNMRVRRRYLPVLHNEAEYFFAGCIAFVVGCILELQTNLADLQVNLHVEEELSHGCLVGNFKTLIYIVIGVIGIFFIYILCYIFLI